MHGSPSSNDKDEGKPSKRIRVSQACEPCRIKKGKCDGRQPTCCVCESLGLDCSYDPNPKKRGLRPGQVSTLERRAALTELIVVFLMSQITDGEKSIRSFFSTEDSALPFLVPGSKRNELEGQLDHWRQGHVSRWLFKTAARVDPALDQLSKYRPQGQGLAPDQHHVPQRNAASEENDVPADSIQPLPTDVLEYLEIYFAYTHTWLPFIDKYKLTAFARSCTSKSRHSSSLKPPESAALALLWTVIAYSSLHMPVGEEFRIHPMKATQIALSFIPSFDAEMEHEHVQALVLLALFHFERGTLNISWVIIGLASRLAVDLSTINPGQHLSSTSRRTSLACFVVEGIIAACLNRKSQLPTLDNHAFPDARVCELEEEGWEEWSSWEIPGRKPSLSPSPHDGEPFRILSTFNQVVHLVETINTSLISMSVETNSHALTIQDGLAKLSTSMQRIGESHSFLALQSSEKQPPLHVLNLHCLYWTSHCVLHWHAAQGELDKQSYEEASHEIASAVNNLVDQYRSNYPFNSAPLAVTASLMAALRLVPTESQPGKSLAKHLFDMREHWGKMSTDNDSKTSLQKPGKRAGHDYDFSMGRSLKRPKNTDLGSQTQDLILSENVETRDYAPAPPTSFNTNANLSEDLDLDMMGVEQSDAMSISAHDLTVLDAAVWNDDLFAMNVGYLGNSQTTLDPDLSSIFESVDSSLQL